jgi:hypothetical protein
VLEYCYPQAQVEPVRVTTVEASNSGGELKQGVSTAAMPKLSKGQKKNAKEKAKKAAQDLSNPNAESSAAVVPSSGAASENPAGVLLTSPGAAQTPSKTQKKKAKAKAKREAAEEAAEMSGGDVAIIQ